MQGNPSIISCPSVMKEYLQNFSLSDFNIKHKMVAVVSVKERNICEVQLEKWQ